MKNEGSYHGAFIHNREQAVEFYRQFLEHPELFDEEGDLPESVQRSFSALEKKFVDLPQDAEPAASPFLGQVEIAIPIEQAIKLLERMGCEPVLAQDPVTELGSNHVVGQALCIMKDPYDNLFMLV
jgi:hypothetical protein